ncbi:MAG: hypothetical protein K6E59_00845 [Bacilli bacterium]|nr:hypothetical protein [Bacilli bacterium]
MDMPACLCMGEAEKCQEDAKQWCLDHDVMFIPLDAKEISVVSVGHFTAGDTAIITFSPLLEGTNFDFEEFLQKDLRGVEEAPQVAMGHRTFLLGKGNVDERTEAIIDFDALPETVFIKDDMCGFEPLKISGALRKKISENPCLVFVTNLFTLSEDSAELFCRRFVRVERKADYPRDNILHMVVLKEPGQEIPYYLRQKNIFLSYIHNDDSGEEE